MVSDKLYIVLVLSIIGLFIYWYQKNLAPPVCQKCIKRKNRKRHSKNNKKTVRFKDNDTDISLDSLDSSDHLGDVSNDDENDSKSCDTLDI
jgi:hypothetical protein